MLRVALLMLILLPQMVFAEVKIIELQHRPANELIDQVRELLDAEEKIQSAGSHIVLIADGDSLIAAEALIKLLDRQLASLTIQVRQRLARQQVASSTGAAVKLGNRSQIVGSAGLRLGNSTTSSVQSLRVTEGTGGMLEIGREIPYTSRWSALVGDVTGYSEQIDYQTVNTGFWVLPIQIQDKSVLVEIEPYLAEADISKNAKAPNINYSQLKSRLQLPLGEWVPLGQQFKTHDRLSRAIISWRSQQGEADQELLLRIDLAEGFSP